MPALAIPRKTMLVLGAGPGIGRSVTRTFASNGYHNIVLIARSAEHLEVEKQALQDAVGGHISVETYAVDLVDTKELLFALDCADAAFGKPDVVFYNAARVRPSALFDHPVEDIEYDLKVSLFHHSTPTSSPFSFPPNWSPLFSSPPLSLPLLFLIYPSPLHQCL